ncbi:MAG: hypothetical protein N2320_02835 [Candidatus Bipolaricaulota bacterium]|nr:hypothetical protein [Candidatus Bipolaricaulota bacterium]
MSGLWDAGLREAVGLALPLAVGISVLGWTWPLGVFVGLGAVASGRLLRWGLIAILRREGGGGLAAGLAGTVRHIFVSLLALGGVALGLPPLAVSAGLLLPTLGRLIWTVRVVRSVG